MVEIIRIDMDFDFEGSEYWVKGEVQMEKDMTPNEVDIIELCRYKDSEEGKIERPMSIAELDSKVNDAIGDAMIEQAIKQMSEEDQARADAGDDRF